MNTPTEKEAKRLETRQANANKARAIRLARIAEKKTEDEKQKAEVLERLKQEYSYEYSYEDEEPTPEPLLPQIKKKSKSSAKFSAEMTQLREMVFDLQLASRVHTDSAKRRKSPPTATQIKESKPSESDSTTHDKPKPHIAPEIKAYSPFRF
jgi:hypothetical protein